jgi:hypothetical protein
MKGPEDGRDKTDNKKIRGDSQKNQGRNSLGTDRPYTDAGDS